MAGIRIEGREQPPADCRNGVVSVGNFDGVHRGHQALLAELRAVAAERGGPAVVVTFDPHPMQLLAPDRFQPLLTTAEHRAELLERAGADRVVILHTAPELLGLEAGEFFRQILRERLRARGVVEGFNFHFGRGRTGDNAALKDWCADAGMAFREVSPFSWDGGVVSSSRVREALQGGDVGEAARLLDRPYRVQGRVGTGARRGRTIGFPTANLEGVETLVPAEGVYAVKAVVDGKTHPAAANIGPNPTFGDNARKLEVHLIDFTGDLYGRTMAVDFLERLRPTRRFASVDELVAQMRQDVDRARQVTAGG